MTNKHKLRKPAGAADQPVSPTSLVRPQISVEHLALALALSEDELLLVCQLGRGCGDRKIARSLGLSVGVVESRLAKLREKTGMTRLSLAVMGYQLAGQPAQAA